MGTAICIAKGMGIYPSLSEASDKMVHIAEVIEPDPSNHCIYEEYFEIYLKTYHSLTDLFHQTSKNPNFFKG